MKRSREKPLDAAELRRRAEKRLRESKKEETPARTEEDTRRLLHKLQVHQIELEMQNEELRQARAEVEAGLERYKDLYDFAPVGYFTLDRNGAIPQVNLTGARLLGVERARLVNRRFGRFVSDDSRPAFAAFLQKVFESQEKGTCEVALLKEGNHPPSSRLSGGQEYGEAGPLSVRIEATVSEDGQECRAAVVDITERKRAEEELRDRAEHYRAVTRSANDAIITVDSTGTIVGWNQSAGKMFGYNEGEIIGQNLILLMPQQYRDLHIVGMKRIQSGGDQHVIGKTVELLGLHKNGQQFPMELSLAEWETSAGKFYTGIVRDITNRKRAEERFRIAAESLSDVIYEWDLGERVQWFGNIDGLMGYGPGEFPRSLGGWGAMLHPDDRDRVMAALDRGLKGEAPYNIEYRIRKKNGSYSYWSARGTVIRDAASKAVRWIGVITDITERKWAEEALRDYAERLQILRGIDRAILAAQSPQAIAEAALKHIRRMIPCQRASVVLFDEEAQERVVLAADTDGLTEVDTGSRAPLERGDLVPCLRRGEAYLVPDLQALSAPTLVEAALRAEGIRTRLSLPLSAQGNLLGALNFGATTVAAFTTEHLEIAREVADQLAVAIQQARLHAAAVRRGEELAALLRAARTVMSGLDLQETLDRILGDAAQISGCSHVKVLLVDKEAGVLRVGALKGTAMSGGDQLPLGIGHSGIVAATGQPLISEDAPNDPRNAYAQRDRELGIVTYLGLPIRIRDEVLGVLTFNTTVPRQYSPEELAYLASFADQAAIAIENARLYEATVRQLTELRAFHDMGQAISSSLSLDEQLGVLVQRLSQATGAQRVLVGLGDAEDTPRLRLSLAYDASRPDPWLHHLDLSPDRYPEILESIRTARPLVIPKVVAEPLLAPVREGLKPLDLRSMIVMPLIVREKTIGAISLGYVGQARTFTDEQIGVLRSFATQAAIAIEKARLFAAAEQRAGELSILREIDHAITSRLELPAVLDAVVAGAMRLLGNPFAQLSLWDEATQRLRFGAALGPEAERVRNQKFKLGLGINGTVALTRQPMVLDDYQASPYVVPECFDVVATITVPILFGDRLLGVLHSHTTQPDRRFTTDDLRRFQMLASQAAIAIENARLYEAIRQHAAELEARVQERTHELEAANRQLQEASRHKSEFLANMSHELRTPLNSIIGFSELLQGQGPGPLTEKQARYLGHVHQGGKHLLRLISDILDLSKVEAGKFVLQPEPLSVAQILEDILVIARGLANKKAQEVQAEIAADLPPLTADPVRFKQILFNLLSNAVKFTPDGGRITLTARRVDWSNGQVVDSSRPVDQLTTRPIDSARDWLEVAVWDTGIGIKPEDMPKLFQEFVQLETTQAQKHEGTGLGLALTRRLVELHGGRIWAASEGEGRGSTFTVVLPFEVLGAPVDALAGVPAW